MNKRDTKPFGTITDDDFHDTLTVESLGEPRAMRLQSALELALSSHRFNRLQFSYITGTPENPGALRIAFHKFDMSGARGLLTGAIRMWLAYPMLRGV